MAWQNGANGALGLEQHSPSQEQQPQPPQQWQPQLQQLQGARITVRGMVKKFETRKGIFTAVDDVTVDMEAGSITALVGPSGSGGPLTLCCLALAGRTLPLPSASPAGILALDFPL